jgi:hypothetical protein
LAAPFSNWTFRVNVMCASWECQFGISGYEMWPVWVVVSEKAEAAGPKSWEYS